MDVTNPIGEITIDSSISHTTPVFTDFNEWFSELVDETEPDIIVAIARGAIRLIELHNAESLIGRIPLLSDHALPFFPDTELKNKVVLLFDDSVVYGSTLSRIRQYLLTRETNVFCASYVVDRKSFLGDKSKDCKFEPNPSEHCNIPLIFKHKLWPQEIVKHHDQIVKTLNSRPNNYNLDFPTFILKLPKFTFHDIPILEHYIKSTNLFRRISDVSSPSSISSGVFRYSCLFNEKSIDLFKEAGFFEIKGNSKVRLTFVPSLSELRITPIIQLNIEDSMLNRSFHFKNQILNGLFNYLRQPQDITDPFYKRSLFRLLTAFVSAIVGEVLIKRLSYSLCDEFLVKSIYLHNSGLNYIIGEDNFNLIVKILTELNTLNFWNEISKRSSDLQSITALTGDEQHPYIDNDLLSKIVNYWKDLHYFKPNFHDLPYEILGKIFLSLRNVTDSHKCRLENPGASRIDIGLTHEELECLIQNYLKIDLDFDYITLALDMCVDNGQAVPKVILKGNNWRRVFYSGENEDAQYTLQLRNALFTAYSDYFNSPNSLPLTAFDFHKICVTLKDIFPDLPISTKYFTFGRFVNFVGKSDKDIVSWLTETSNSPFIIAKKNGKTVLMLNNEYRPQVTHSWLPQMSRDFFDAFQFMAFAFLKLPSEAKLLISTCRTHRHTYNSVAYEAHSWVSHMTTQDFSNLLSGLSTDSNEKLTIKDYAIDSLFWCSIYINEAFKKYKTFHEKYNLNITKLRNEFLEQGPPAKRFFKYFMLEREGFFDETTDKEIDLRFKLIMPIISQMALLTKFVAAFTVKFIPEANRRIKDKFANENALSLFDWLYSDDFYFIAENYNSYLGNPNLPGQSIIKTQLPLSIAQDQYPKNSENFYKTCEIIQNCYKEISQTLSIYCPEYKITGNDFPYSPDNFKRVRTDGSIEHDVLNTCILTLDIIGSTDSKEGNEFKEYILATLKKFKRAGYYFEDTGNDAFIACFNTPILLLDIARALLPEEERLKLGEGKVRGTRKGLYSGNVTVLTRPNQNIIIRDQLLPEHSPIPRAFSILNGVDEYCKSKAYSRNQVFIIDAGSAKIYKDELNLKITEKFRQRVRSKHFTGPCYVFPLIQN